MLRCTCSKLNVVDLKFVYAKIFKAPSVFLFYFWSLDKINVSSNRQIFYHCKTVCVLLLLTNFHKYWFLDVLRCLANFMSPLVVQLKTTEQDFFRLVRVNRS